MTQPTSAKHARKTDSAAGATAAKPAKSRRKAISLLALGIATALVAGQVAGTSYYGSHFVPGTTVNGADVSNMTEAELTRQVATSAASWKTTVAGQGLAFAIGATDIDLDVSPADYARDAKAQTDAASWALDLAHPRHITVSKTVAYNRKKLDALVDAAVQAHNQSAKPPKNAWCALNQKTSTFEVTQEALGTALDANVVKAQVEKGVARLHTKVSLKRDALLRPQLTSTDAGLLKAVDTANAYAGHAITLTKDGKPLAKLDKKTVATWVRVGDDLSVGLDRDAIAQWARDSLAKKVAKSDEEHDYAIDAASLAASVTNAAQGEKDGHPSRADARPRGPRPPHRPEPLHPVRALLRQGRLGHLALVLRERQYVRGAGHPHGNVQGQREAHERDARRRGRGRRRRARLQEPRRVLDAVRRQRSGPARCQLALRLRRINLLLCGKPRLREPSPAGGARALRPRQGRRHRLRPLVAARTRHTQRGGPRRTRRSPPRPYSSACVSTLKPASSSLNTAFDASAGTRIFRMSTARSPDVLKQ